MADELDIPSRFRTNVLRVIRDDDGVVSLTGTVKIFDYKVRLDAELDMSDDGTGKIHHLR